MGDQEKAVWRQWWNMVISHHKIDIFYRGTHSDFCDRKISLPGFTQDYGEPLHNLCKGSCSSLLSYPPISPLLSLSLSLSLSLFLSQPRIEFVWIPLQLHLFCISFLIFFSLSLYLPVCLSVCSLFTHLILLHRMTTHRVSWPSLVGSKLWLLADACENVT